MEGERRVLISSKRAVGQSSYFILTINSGIVSLKIAMRETCNLYLRQVVWETLRGDDQDKKKKKKWADLSEKGPDSIHFEAKFPTIRRAINSLRNAGFSVRDA